MRRVGTTGSGYLSASARLACYNGPQARAMCWKAEAAVRSRCGSRSPRSWGGRRGADPAPEEAPASAPVPAGNSSAAVGHADRTMLNFHRNVAGAARSRLRTERELAMENLARHLQVGILNGFIY